MFRSNVCYDHGGSRQHISTQPNRHHQLYGLSKIFPSKISFITPFNLENIRFILLKHKTRINRFYTSMMHFLYCRLFF
jgi:hypothetical protein